MNLLRRLRYLVPWVRRREERELNDEMEALVRIAADEAIESGIPPADADLAAQRTLGNITLAKEDARAVWGWLWLDNLSSDLRFSLRVLRKQPAFAAVAIVSLALGMGANTAAFSIADAVLFKMLPVREPERLIQVLQPDGPGLTEYGERFSVQDFRTMKESVSPFAQIAAETEIRRIASMIDGTSEEISGETLRRGIVSGDYFDVLGVGPATGRTFSPEEDREPGRHPVAVISYGLWKRRFNLDPLVLDRTIRIGKNSFKIIGVAPPGFFGLEVGAMADAWTPIAMEPAEGMSLRLIGRLNPGATGAQAVGPLQALFHQHMVDMVGHAPPGTPSALIDRILRLTVKIIPAAKGVSSLRAEYGKPLQIVFGLIALVLLVACTTVATLFEARAGVRQREMAVRASLGAGRWRLLRQLLAESALIACASAVFGLLLAHWTTPLLVRLLAPSDTPVQLALGLDVRVLAFTAIVCILTALLFGLAPAWHASNLDLHAALKSGTRRARGGGARTGKIMVASQVALSLVLLMGASLFVRTLVKLSTFDIGFDRDNVIIADVQFRGQDKDEPLHLAWEELRRRISTIPGIESVSLSSGSVFNGAYGNGALRLQGIPPDMKNLTGGIFFHASANFFHTMGTPLLKGRDFQPRDFQPSAPPVAIVSESLARPFFGNDNPLGRRFSNFEDIPPRWVEVIGVAKDTKYESLRAPAQRVIYLPYTWPHPAPEMSIAVRARTDMAALSPALRREVRAANTGFAVERITTQSKLINDTLVRERLLATVGGFFGVLALLMAAIGLYGVMSYTVTQRTQEIGIRMALGATRHEVLGMILRESLLVVAAGAIVGAAAAQACARVVSTLLFGVSAQDPATAIIAVCVLVAAALAAAFIPARRAAQTEPIVALRYD